METFAKQWQAILNYFPLYAAIDKKYIPYFQNKKMWAGSSRVSTFENPKRQISEVATHWYTNLPVLNRNKHSCLKSMPLSDIPENHKCIDDTGVLLTDELYVPNDYDKPFAISVSPIYAGLLESGYKIIQSGRYEPYINGKEQFAKLLVQKEAI